MVPVLHGIDIEIQSGELTMLMGPSGCGKTTLISIIAGILSPSGGSVEVCGEPITAMSDTKRVAFRRRVIGFIFQQYNLLPSLSAAENAAIPLIATGWPMHKANAKAEALLAGLGMADHVDKRPNQLSGGQQQRVAIARALVHEPRLIVCDEPTAALDADTGRAVMTMLKHAALSPDRAVVVVTHDPRVHAFADRIATMDDGRITACGLASAAALNGLPQHAPS
jgi:putative ABC transport system ATP-binding protein